NGNYLRSFGVYGGGIGELWVPSGIHVTANGNLYIAHEFTSEIIVLNYSGDYLYSIGMPGFGPSELSSPCDVLVTPSGTVYIVDVGNHGVKVFSPQPVTPDPTSGLALNGSFENEPPLMEWTYGGTLPVSRSTTASHGNYS